MGLFLDKINTDIGTTETEVTAGIRDTKTRELRNIFVRLIDLGATKIDEIESYTVEDATADFDKEGNLIGINISFFRDL